MAKGTKDKNENCLAGMRCPECGALEPYLIALFSWIEVVDEGTRFCEDEERWTDDSECRCLTCDYSGQVRDFREAGAAR